MTTFDSHTHWGECFQVRDRLDPLPWLACLDKHRIDRAVVLPWLGLFDAEKIERENTELSRLCAASGGRMMPFCTVNARWRDAALRELERSLGTLGFRGVKFHPWLQGQSVSTDVMDAVCERAGHFNVPVFFHDGTPPFSLPSQIALLARRHPNTTLILGHCGMLEHWREAAAALATTPNLWGCLCSPHPAALDYIMSRADLGRLVWGSDYGMNFSDTLGYRLEMMTGRPVGDGVLQMILSDNPARLFGLP